MTLWKERFVTRKDKRANPKWLALCFSFVFIPFFCVDQGVAMGIGLCANSHLEGTLAKLEEFGKSDAFKKSQSIFNLLKVLRCHIETFLLHLKI